MTCGEFRKWIDTDKQSGFDWIIDVVTFYNKGIILAYLGGESGLFFEITNYGKFSLGTYKYASPCITDGEFKTEFTKLFVNRASAIAYINSIQPRLEQLFDIIPKYGERDPFMFAFKLKI